jgi:hypothetical protein
VGRGKGDVLLDRGSGTRPSLDQGAHRDHQRDRRQNCYQKAALNSL